VKFQLRKKIEAKFSDQFPELWTPLYSMVTFSPDVPYSKALEIGDQQKKIMDQIMQRPNIDDAWDSQDVMDELHKLTAATFGELQ
jgi:kynurenine 3-monooxygenase